MAEKCKSEGCKECSCHEVDLADPRACDDLCHRCPAVDVLVNNAGVFGPSSGSGEHAARTACSTTRTAAVLSAQPAPSAAELPIGCLVRERDAC